MKAPAKGLRSSASGPGHKLGIVDWLDLLGGTAEHR